MKPLYGIILTLALLMTVANETMAQRGNLEHAGVEMSYIVYGGNLISKTVKLEEKRENNWACKTLAINRTASVGSWLSLAGDFVKGDRTTIEIEYYFQDVNGKNVQQNVRINYPEHCEQKVMVPNADRLHHVTGYIKLKNDWGNYTVQCKVVWAIVDATSTPSQPNGSSANPQQTTPNSNPAKPNRPTRPGDPQTPPSGVIGHIFTVNNLHYKILSKNTVEVTGELRGSYKGRVEIPNVVTYQGKSYKVVGIGQNAFANQTRMTEVDIPKSVQYIEANAFQNTGLTQVIVSGDKVNVKKHAFHNNKKLVTVTLNGKKPQCSASAFEGCTAMKELRIRGINASNNGKKLNGTNAVIKVIK